MDNTAILFLDIHLRKKSLIQEDVPLCLLQHCQEQPRHVHNPDRCPSGEYIMEHYSEIKSGILPFAVTWIDSEDIMLSEIKQGKTNTL